MIPFMDLKRQHAALETEVMAAAERALTSRTKVIMPVHLYGHPAALDALRRACKPL